MIEKDLVKLISEIETEYEYDEEIVFSKFVKKYGENYTREQFLEFLKKRYEIINKFMHLNNLPSPDYSRPGHLTY